MSGRLGEKGMRCTVLYFCRPVYGMKKTAFRLLDCYTMKSRHGFHMGFANRYLERYLLTIYYLIYSHIMRLIVLYVTLYGTLFILYGTYGTYGMYGTFFEKNHERDNSPKTCVTKNRNGAKFCLKILSVTLHLCYLFVFYFI